MCGVYPDTPGNTTSLRNSFTTDLYTLAQFNVTGAANTGYVKRRQLAQLSRHMYYQGPLLVSLLQQTKFLIPGLEVRHHLMSTYIVLKHFLHF